MAVTDMKSMYQMIKDGDVVFKDTLPGSSWSNPVWHGRWRIYTNDYVPHRSAAVVYSHDDFDGAPDANDDRCGYAESFEAAKAEIDERYP